MSGQAQTATVGVVGSQRMHAVDGQIIGKCKLVRTVLCVGKISKFNRLSTRWPSGGGEPPLLLKIPTYRKGGRKRERKKLTRCRAQSVQERKSSKVVIANRAVWQFTLHHPPATRSVQSDALNHVALRVVPVNVIHCVVDGESVGPDEASLHQDLPV